VNGKKYCAKKTNVNFSKERDIIKAKTEATVLRKMKHYFIVGFKEFFV